MSYPSEKWEVTKSRATQSKDWSEYPNVGKSGLALWTNLHHRHFRKSLTSFFSRFLPKIKLPWDYPLLLWRRQQRRKCGKVRPGPLNELTLVTDILENHSHLFFRDFSQKFNYPECHLFLWKVGNLKKSGLATWTNLHHWHIRKSLTSFFLSISPDN